ncbi:MAG: hypothetical protein ACRED5_03770 [Propylenella sp.]
MTPLETISFDSGLTAKIYHDADTEMPFNCDDAVRIVVLHRRYIDPAGGECGCDPDEVAAWERDNADRWFTIPLFLYDHSGVIYRTGYGNPFHCPWDSGRVGIVALRRADWGDGNEPDERLAEYAQSVAEEYSSWANGECYGYVLCDPAGHELDSCWGFIGTDHVRQEAAAAASAHDPGDVARVWRMACPQCGRCDSIDIAATVWVLLAPDGTDSRLARCGDHEWNDEHAATCHDCGFRGKVADFRIGADGKAGAS